MIKIAFFDVDGTLLKMGHKELSERTLHALTSLRQNGVKLCMATGRGYLSAPRFPGIDFDALLTFNGSDGRAFPRYSRSCDSKRGDAALYGIPA